MGDAVSRKSTKYRRKQVTLPLENASSLSAEQLQQLMMLQGRRIPILDWELNLLITDCANRGCMDKGLAILYEYAGHMDTVKRLVDIRHQAALQVFQRDSGSSSSDPEVGPLLVELCNVNINILIALGNLRAIQFSPKSILTPISTPISVSSKAEHGGGVDPPQNILETFSVENKRVPLDACLREEARILHKVYKNALSRVPPHCAAFLLAPKMGFTEVCEVLESTSNEKYEHFMDLEGPVRAVTNIISIEDDIATAYKVIRSTAKTHQSPFNELPTLRLSYPGHVPPATYAWFGKALEVYSPSILTLVAAMEDHGISVTPLGSSSSSSRSRKGKGLGDRGGEGAGVNEEKSSSGDMNGDNDPFGETGAMIDVSRGGRGQHAGLQVPTPSQAALNQPRPGTSPAVMNNSGKMHGGKGGGGMIGTNSAPGSPVHGQVMMTPQASAGVPPAPQTVATSPSRSIGKGSRSNSFSSSNGGGGKKGSSRQNSNQNLMSATAPPGMRLQSNSNYNHYDYSSGGHDDVIVQMSPSKHGQLDGPVGDSSPIDVDFSFVGGGVGSGVGTPTGKSQQQGQAANRRGSTPSKKPDIKKRIGSSMKHSSSSSSSASAGGREGGTKSIRFAKGSGSGKDSRNEQGKDVYGESTRAKQEKVLSTKAHQALSFMSLAAGPNIGFSKGEARAESQLIQINIKDANVSGEALVRLAARKISLWWHYMGPRRKLRHRMDTRAICLSLVTDIVQESALKALKRRRQKAVMMRHGSAVTIQRMIKHWFYVTRRRTVPMGGWGYSRGRGVGWGGLEGPVPGLYRHDSHPAGAAFGMTESVHSVSSDVFRDNASNPVSPRGGVQSPLGRRSHSRSFVLRGGGQGGGQGGGRDRRATEYPGGHHTKKRRWNKSRAATVINNTVRSVLAKRRVAVLREQRKAEIKAKKKRMSTFSREKGAIIIQCAFRSSIARNRMYMLLRASWIIARTWRIYLAYKRLRSDLRRVEKPRLLHLSSLRNLPRQFGDIDYLQIKISAYWGGLLHIFTSEHELRSCIKGKKPQCVTYSKVVPVLKQGSAGRAKTSRGSIFERILGGTMDGGGASPLFPMLQNNNKSDSTLGEDSAGLNSGLVAFEAVFNEVVRIPGTHGNSILSFEYLAGDEVVAESLFLMSMHGDLMIWDENFRMPIKYRSIQKNQQQHGDKYNSNDAPSSKLLIEMSKMETEKSRSKRGNLQTTPKFDLMGPQPELVWKLSSGLPFSSRCGPAKVHVSTGFSVSHSGRGPVLTALYREFGIIRTAITTWRKLFLSFDGEDLAIWASHHSSAPLVIISKRDIAATYVKLGKPTQPYSTGIVIEDTFDLNLYTTSHELLSLRFQDVGSRVRWNETLTFSLRGYTSFKAMAGSESDDDDASDKEHQYEFGRVVEEGEKVYIPGQSRMSVMLNQASDMVGNIGGKITSIVQREDEDGASKGGGYRRARRASALISTLHADILAAEFTIPEPAEGDDDSDDSDTTSQSDDGSHKGSELSD